MLLLLDISGWAKDVIDRLGYVGVGVLVALESIVPPIPSEVILPLAGFQADQGDFNLVLLIVVATIGSVVGAMVLYAVGALLGEERIRWLVDHVGRFVLLSRRDVDRATGWFDRHGRSAVFIGRLVPVVRSLVSLPAGIDKMPLGTFLVFTAAGSAVWNTVLIVAGYLLGTQWERVDGVVSIIQYVVLAAIATAAVVFVRRRLGGRHRATGTPA